MNASIKGPPIIERIHQLIRAEAFDETVMEPHIDEESIHYYLATLFATTTVATATQNWDVATFIEALEELNPLRVEHRRPQIGICCYPVRQFDTSQMEPGSGEHRTGAGESSIQVR